MALLAGQARAQAVAVLDGTVERIDLWPYVRVLQDPTGTLELQHVLTSPEKFAVPTGAYASLGMGKDVFWVRIPVKVSAGGEGPWIFDLDYALMNRVELYMLANGKVAHHFLLGDDQPANGPCPDARTPRNSSSAPALGRDPHARQQGGRRDPALEPLAPAGLPRTLDEHLFRVRSSASGSSCCSTASPSGSTCATTCSSYALLVVCSVMFSVHFFGIGQMYLWTNTQWPQNHMAGVTAHGSGCHGALRRGCDGTDLHPGCARRSTPWPPCVG